jgi:hypothetical protein
MWHFTKITQNHVVPGMVHLFSVELFPYLKKPSESLLMYLFGASKVCILILIIR